MTRTVGGNSGSASGGMAGTGGSGDGGTGGVDGTGGTGGVGGTATGGTGGTGGGGTSCLPSGTLEVTNSGFSAYLIGEQENPMLTFCRGNTYTFSVDASGHPFWIKTVATTGSAGAYSSGVTNNGSDEDNIVFAVPSNAPNTLYYRCEFHGAMGGTIQIVD